MSYLPVQTKSSRLSETGKAAVGSVLLLALALAAALLIRAVECLRWWLRQDRGRP